MDGNSRFILDRCILDIFYNSLTLIDVNKPFDSNKIIPWFILTSQNVVKMIVLSIKCYTYIKWSILTKANRLRLQNTEFKVNFNLLYGLTDFGWFPTSESKILITVKKSVWKDTKVAFRQNTRTLKGISYSRLRLIQKFQCDELLHYMSYFGSISQNLVLYQNYNTVYMILFIMILVLCFTVR